jgi:hypothetical protein
LNRSADQKPGPIDHPPTNPHQTQTTARPIVYSDHKIGIPGDTVHFGDRVVETGNDEVHLDVTDDGFLYTDRGGVWFSDGGTPEQVGSQLCAGLPTGELSNRPSPSTRDRPRSGDRASRSGPCAGQSRAGPRAFGVSVRHQEALASSRVDHSARCRAATSVPSVVEDGHLGGIR